METPTPTTPPHHFLKQADLPACCPRPEERLWNAHPRVYLPLESGHAICPYCSAEFTLVTQPHDQG